MVTKFHLVGMAIDRIHTSFRAKRPDLQMLSTLFKVPDLLEVDPTSVEGNSVDITSPGLNQLRIRFSARCKSSEMHVYKVAAFNFWSALLTSSPNLREYAGPTFLVRNPNDGPAIKNFLAETISLFDIKSRVVSITTDNTAANICAIRDLAEEFNLHSNFDVGFYHIRCLAHIINLGVCKAIECLKPLVASIRSVVTDIRASSKRSQTFADIQAEMIYSGGLPLKQPLKLKMEVATRWNATFLMLERAYLLSNAIDKAIHTMHDLSEVERIDWHELKLVIDFLKPFHEATERISGEKYSTVAMFMYMVPRLISHLEDDFQSSDAQRTLASAQRKYQRPPL